MVQPTHASSIPAKAETIQHQKDSLRTVTTKYTLADIPMNGAGSVEGGKTIIVPYVYDKTETVTVNGSVIATYKDIEGNELAHKKTWRQRSRRRRLIPLQLLRLSSSEVVEKTPEGLWFKTNNNNVWVDRNP